MCVHNPYNSCTLFFLCRILGSQSYKVFSASLQSTAGGPRLPKMCNATTAAIEQEPRERVCPPLAKSITINLSKSQAFPLVLLAVKCKSASTGTEQEGLLGFEGGDVIFTLRIISIRYD